MIENLQEILEKHVKWLRSEDGGERADLRYADLRNANLCNANLSNANLSYANLSYADLRNANLCYANLCNANLRNADLSYADLRNADLRNANLRNADLCNADLSYADLRNANLCNANLRNADLCNADLSYADLRNANIEERIKQKFYPLVCPEVGSFIGWKTNNDYIIKLQITETALRSSAYGRKCRASEALVLAIENKDGTPAEVQEVFSAYDEKFAYHVGDLVKPRLDFDPDRWNECSSGIHFFITRQEAVDYNA